MNRLNKFDMFLLGLLVGIISFGIFGFILLEDGETEIGELKKEINKIVQSTAEETLHGIKASPAILFDTLYDAPAWKEIKAVPYSICYQHLLDAHAADYIMCKAI